MQQHHLGQAHKRVLDVAVLPATGSAPIHRRLSQDLCSNNKSISTIMCLGGCVPWAFWLEFAPEESAGRK